MHRFSGFRGCGVLEARSFFAVEVSGVDRFESGLECGPTSGRFVLQRSLGFGVYVGFKSKSGRGIRVCCLLKNEDLGCMVWSGV